MTVATTNTKDTKTNDPNTKDTNIKRAVLRVRPGQFVATPPITQVVTRALRYLNSGFSVHLRGPAGTGKTTLAMHLANSLARPVMLIFGDNEFKSSDLIGSQTGYTHKKLVDNYIHTVLKVEDELKHSWVDSRLTLACREGFTLVYDEFNRSRPEVNNVLLSALEEKILTLPPNSNQQEYLQVHPQFRAIFTSNPEEYYGVHSTQDALMDRLVTINVPEPDEPSQTEIIVHKTGITKEAALLIVRLVRTFRINTEAKKTSGLRACLMIAKVCAEHSIAIAPDNTDFREICFDVLLSRTDLPASEAAPIFSDILNKVKNDKTKPLNSNEQPSPPVVENADSVDVENGETEASNLDETIPQSETNLENLTLPEQEVYNYLQQQKKGYLTEIHRELKISRRKTEIALNSLLQKNLLTKQNHIYTLIE